MALYCNRAGACCFLTFVHDRYTPKMLSDSYIWQMVLSYYPASTRNAHMPTLVELMYQSLNSACRRLLGDTSVY